MPITQERLMQTVLAGQTIASTYKTIISRLRTIGREASSGTLSIPQIIELMNHELVGAENLILRAEHILEIESILYAKSHRQNERVKQSMARLRQRRTGMIPVDQREVPTMPLYPDQIPGRYPIKQAIEVPRPRVRVKGPDKNVEYDEATQAQIEMAQGLRPIDNPNDDVTAALQGAFGQTDTQDGGASLQFEVAASPPTAEEQAQALAEALAAETPDEFKPKGLTALEWGGMKLI